jgi:aspartate kinase
MLIVQKYGGTSVGNVERIKAVADRVVTTINQGNKVVVVVSAMSGETDKMIGLAKKVSSSPSEREMDVLLSSGERVTTALLAMAITDLGQKAIALTGRQAGIITNDVYTKAKIERISPEKLNNSLDEGYCVVLAGFQGMTEAGDVTTLGRGGSDLSAVAIAVAVKADLCEIYTDVDGVYTADPNIVPDARKLEKISFEEMLELASLGAKVLQTRSVEFACKYNIPLVVRSSFNNNPGTLVTKEDNDMEKFVVSGVASDKNQAKLTIMGVPDRPGIAATIFNAIAGNNIIVDVIVQNVSADGRFADI